MVQVMVPSSEHVAEIVGRQGECISIVVLVLMSKSVVTQRLNGGNTCEENRKKVAEQLI